MTTTRRMQSQTNPSRRHGAHSSTRAHTRHAHATPRHAHHAREIMTMVIPYISISHAVCTATNTANTPTAPSPDAGIHGGGGSGP